MYSKVAEAGANSYCQSICKYNNNNNNNCKYKYSVKVNACNT